MRTETRRLKCPLAAQEVASRAALLASESLELANMEDQLESFLSGAKDAAKARKEAIAAKRGEIAALAEQVAGHCETRHQECEWRADLDAGTEYLVRLDTGAAVERRPISPERRQLIIGERLEEANADQIKLWESQLAPEPLSDEAGGAR